MSIKKNTVATINGVAISNTYYDDHYYKENQIYKFTSRLTRSQRRALKVKPTDVALYNREIVALCTVSEDVLKNDNTRAYRFNEETTKILTRNVKFKILLSNDPAISIGSTVSLRLPFDMGPYYTLNLHEYILGHNKSYRSGIIVSC